MFEYSSFLVLLTLTTTETSCCGKLKFPPGFKFGVATASYQIEGGWNANGKGENIWDHLVHKYPKLIKDGKTGDVACDSYHLWKEDLRILKNLNVSFYRFSLSWSRLLPNGFSNKINPDGVRYYNDLINALLENRIEPMVTLYHWDLPQSLQKIGGWLNPVLATYFENYAQVAFELFGDRVKTWITINEPASFCVDAYESDTNAPAYSKLPGIGLYLCGQTVLMAHARVYHLYDKKFRSKQKGKIGITINSTWREPKSNSTQDRQAAERAMQMELGWWAHPIFSKTGDYPDIMKMRIEEISLAENYSQSRLPAFSKKDVKFIRDTYDFFALNHYSSWLISDHKYPISSPTSQKKDEGIISEQDKNWAPSAATWLKVVPWGFRKLLNWIKKEYDNPLVYITENGFADRGELNDYGRIHYHKVYLKNLLEAIITDGCNVKAYTIWSVLDNMEWRDGYTLKFGLYHVDFDSPNRTRTKKLSADFYKTVIETKSVPDEIVTPPYSVRLN